MKDRALQIASPLILLVVWEILVKVGILDVRFFAPPSEIAGRLAQLINDGTMWRETAVTMRRVLVGFTLASVPAVLLGIVMGINRPIRLFFTPLPWKLSARRPLPSPWQVTGLSGCARERVLANLPPARIDVLTRLDGG